VSLIQKVNDARALLCTASRATNPNTRRNFYSTWLSGKSSKNEEHNSNDFNPGQELASLKEAQY